MDPVKNFGFVTVSTGYDVTYISHKSVYSIWFLL